MDSSDGYFNSQLLNSFARKRKRAREEEEDEDENEDSEDVNVVVATFFSAGAALFLWNNSTVSGSAISPSASTHAELIIFRNSDMLFPSAILIYGT